VAPILPPASSWNTTAATTRCSATRPRTTRSTTGEVTLRGSALRSRGIEPFLKRLSDQLIALPARRLDGRVAAAGARSRISAPAIAAREQPVAELAKSETLSQNPDAYERLMAEGGKPRRAAAEVALQLTRGPGWASA
jgi:DNA polymerase I